MPGPEPLLLHRKARIQGEEPGSKPGFRNWVPKIGNYGEGYRDLARTRPASLLDNLLKTSFFDRQKIIFMKYFKV